MTAVRVWNGGQPVWNKGKQMRPPLECMCSKCGVAMSIPSGSSANRNARYRLRLGLPAYCSAVCRKIATREKISATLMGHPGHLPGPEGLARRTAALRGRTPWNKGKPQSPEHRAKRGHAIKHSPKAIAHRARMHSTYKGSASPHWKGGITPEHKLIRQSAECKQWRAAVMVRDDYTCQECGRRGGTMHADHIKPFAAYPELRWELSNGRTLCVSCHRNTPTYGRPRRGAA